MDRSTVKNAPRGQHELATSSSLVHQAGNPASSLPDSLMDGRKTVSEELYRQRMEACGRCELHRDGDGANGCRLPSTARDQTALCPMNKWPLVKSADS